MLIYDFLLQRERRVFPGLRQMLTIDAFPSTARPLRLVRIEARDDRCIDRFLRESRRIGFAALRFQSRMRVEHDDAIANLSGRVHIVRDNDARHFVTLSSP